MKELLRAFQTYLKIDCGFQPNTISSYVSDCLLFSEWLQKEYKIFPEEAQGIHLENYFSSELTAGLSFSSRNRKLSALKNYFSFLEKEGHLSKKNPLENFENIPTKRPLPKTLSQNEVKNLLEAPEKKLLDPQSPQCLRDTLILRTLYAGGLRVCELTNLTLGQMDLETGVLRLEGKGGKHRLVPLDGDTCLLLKEYLKRGRPYLGPYQQTDTVFLNQKGAPLTRQAIWLMIQDYSKVAGLSKTPSPHSLRHAFATHLLEGGMNLRSLQTLLGHSDISTTEIYTHLSHSHLRDQVESHHPLGKKHYKMKK